MSVIEKFVTKQHINICVQILENLKYYELDTPKKVLIALKQSVKNWESLFIFQSLQSWIFLLSIIPFRITMKWIPH